MGVAKTNGFAIVVDGDIPSNVVILGSEAYTSTNPTYWRRITNEEPADGEWFNRSFSTDYLFVLSNDKEFTVNPVSIDVGNIAKFTINSNQKSAVETAINKFDVSTLGDYTGTVLENFPYYVCVQCSLGSAPSAGTVVHANIEIKSSQLEPEPEPEPEPSDPKDPEPVGDVIMVFGVYGDEVYFVPNGEEEHFGNYYSSDIEDTFMFIGKDLMSTNWSDMVYGQEITDQLLPINTGYYGSGGGGMLMLRQNTRLKLCVMSSVPITKFSNIEYSDGWKETDSYMKGEYSSPSKFILKQCEVTEEEINSLHAQTIYPNDGSKWVGQETKLSKYKYVYAFEFFFDGKASYGYDVWHLHLVYYKGEEEVEPEPEQPEEPDVPKPPIGQSEFAFVNMYNPTFDELVTAANTLYIGDDIDLTRYIVSLHKVFVPVSVSDDREIIRFGKYKTSVNTHVINNRYARVSCGKVLVQEAFVNALDYSPYTSVRIWLPFLGFYDISIDEIMNKEIELIYTIDLVNGKALAEICTDNGVVYRFVGMAYEQEPYYLEKGSEVSTAYVNEAYSMAESTPYLLLERPIYPLPDESSQLDGEPTFEYCILGDKTGYVRCKEVIVDGFIRSDEERSEIETLLKKGVIL